MFENIVGHKENIDRLSNDIIQNAPSHAYVFYGRKGIGKALVAKEFAKELLKSNNLEGCVDFKYICPYEDKQNILVEQVRDELIEDIYIAPACGEYKVYIIDDAEKMNITSQNALLKTLEEPPKAVVMILITSNIDGLLKTILSRTTNIYFDCLDTNQIKRYVTSCNIEVSDEMIEFANGSIGMLKTILFEANKEIIHKIDEIMESILKKDKLGLISKFKELDFGNIVTVQYFEFLLFKNKLYDKIILIENIKQAIVANASEDMQKTKLAIQLLE